MLHDMTDRGASSSLPSFLHYCNIISGRDDNRQQGGLEKEADRWTGRGTQATDKHTDARFF